MPWARIEDGFDDDPELDLIGPVAVCLFVCSITWSNRQRTDGFIPNERAHKLTGGTGEAIAALVKYRWWLSVDGGYQIRSFLRYNMSAEEVETHREHVSAVRSDAGKKGMKSRWCVSEIHGIDVSKIHNDNVIDITKMNATSGIYDNKITKPITNTPKNDNKKITPNPESRIPESRVPESDSAASAPPRKVRERKVFDRPSLHEVESYFETIGCPGQGEAFCDHHDARGWVLSNREKMVDWRAACRTWKRFLPKYGGKIVSGTIRYGTASPSNITGDGTAHIVGRASAIEASLKNANELSVKELTAQNDRQSIFNPNGNDRVPPAIPEHALE